MPKLYQVNAPNVSSENIDGEVIIVNLESGSYYSTVDLGAFIWSRITAGDSAEAIETQVVAAFDAEPEAVKAGVADFIARLETEQLVVKCNGHGALRADSAGAGIVEASLPAEFSVPELNCYADMQDMLLLDPVHDVADVGWPTAKPQQ